MTTRRSRMSLAEEGMPPANGELAWHGKGQRRVSLIMHKDRIEGGTRGELLFTEGRKTILTVRADLFRDRNEKRLGRATLTATGKGIDYVLSLDASNIRLNASNPPD